VVAPSSVTLSDYLTSLRNLLHDPSDTGWSLALKTSFINEAIQQRDIDTGGRRALGSFTLTIGTDTYSFTTLSTAFTNPTANIFDIIGINLIYAGYRIVLEQISYTEQNSYPGYRAYTALNDRPAAWSRYGDQSIIIGPPPAQAYVIEIDALTYSVPAALAALTDADAVQYPYTYPVPLYSAYLCKQNEREYEEAEFYLDRYRMAVNQINSVRTGMVPSMYPRGTTRAS
jgi:hypothetical protein